MGIYRTCHSLLDAAQGAVSSSGGGSSSRGVLALNSRSSAACHLHRRVEQGACQFRCGPSPNCQKLPVLMSCTMFCTDKSEDVAASSLTFNSMSVRLHMARKAGEQLCDAALLPFGCSQEPCSGVRMGLSMLRAMPPAPLPPALCWWPWRGAFVLTMPAVGGKGSPSSMLQGETDQEL